MYMSSRYYATAAALLFHHSKCGLLHLVLHGQSDEDRFLFPPCGDLT
jgi:hypothetical protein